MLTVKARWECQFLAGRFVYSIIQLENGLAAQYLEYHGAVSAFTFLYFL